jgi:hypothetical protein
MALDFTPQIDDQVEVFGYKGRFAVRECKIGADGHCLFRLESSYPGMTLDDIRYPMMTYPPEEKVRKALSQILPECGQWPEDFQVGKYDVKSDAMYDGTPRVTVYFYLKPDAIPSPEKARAWNNFYLKLNDAFRFVDIDSGACRLWDVDPGNLSTWLQFSTKEERSVQSAAS